MISSKTAPQRDPSLPVSGDDDTSIRHRTAYPQLNLKVFMVGSCFVTGAIGMFAKAGCTAAKDLGDADLVVFLGGEDVDPSLYGENKHPTTYFNKARDAKEMEIFTEAVKLGTPMFGICRGMQFLHVMNGGKLYQNVRNHGRTHGMRDYRTGEIMEISSMHHQMVIDNDSTFVIGVAENPGHGAPYDTARNTMSWNKHEDIEAAIYPNINAIAVQGHPEVTPGTRFTEWTIERIKEFLEELSLMGSNSKPISEVEFIKRNITT